MNLSNSFAQDQSTPFIKLTVLISPSEHSIEGLAVITVPEGVPAQFSAGKIQINAVKIIDGPSLPTDEVSLNKYLSDTGTKRHFELSYSAVFGLPEAETAPSDKLHDVIDSAGSTLFSGWYPSLSIPAVYSLSAEIPEGYEVVSESESVQIEEKDETRIFHFAYLYPRTEVSLVAGKYILHHEVYNDIPVSIYSFSNNKEHLTKYISALKQFLTRYDTMLGGFPFQKFSLVENRSISVSSFPTYGLISPDEGTAENTIEVLIGRIVLRQWFGNRILVDPSSGNWSAGLITYLADHWIAGLSGSGKDYRKRIMVLYDILVNSENELSLSEYTGQTSAPARAVGDGKGAMVFHMIRKKIGDDSFFGALRQVLEKNDLKNVSWDDLCNAFSSSSGMDLHAYCDQWIIKRGVPSVQIKDIFPVYRNGQNIIDLDLGGSGFKEQLDVPLTVKFQNKTEDFSVSIGPDPVSRELVLDRAPSSLTIDPGYDLMRSLDPAEIPPLFITFSANMSNIAVLPEKDIDALSPIIDALKEKGFTLKTEKDIRNSDLRDHSFLLFSPDSKIYKRLFAGRPFPEDNVIFQVLSNPLDNGKVAVIINTKDIKSLKEAINMKRYGYTSLLRGGTGGEKRVSIDPAQEGIIADMRVPVSGIETGKALSLNDITEKIKNSTYICIGEIHNEYSHHLMQFEIIKRLHGSGRKIVIGMEMFQRPYQEFLDSYIAGKIEEKEFLERTEYFKRWSFNYNLYRDIIEYARANRIPVKALNLRKEIIDKVSLSGLDSLSDDEFAEIPQLLDMTNRDYRHFMMSVFRQHARSADRKFDNFYQSQILWDETMALSISEASQENPDAAIVVLAGNGHLQNSWGIPDRVKRLTGKKPVLILNGGTDSIETTLADYILFPGKADAPEPPLLNIILKKDDEKVTVEKVIKGGPADKAGIRENDIIRSIDNHPVKDIADLKLILFYKKPGDTITVTVDRKRFLFGTKTLEVSLTL